MTEIAVHHSIDRGNSVRSEQAKNRSGKGRSSQSGADMSALVCSAITAGNVCFDTMGLVASEPGSRIRP